MIYICQECGSKDVQVKEWVNLNTGANCGAAGDQDLNNPENNYCCECEEGTVIIQKEE